MNINDWKTMPLLKPSEKEVEGLARFEVSLYCKGVKPAICLGFMGNLFLLGLVGLFAVISLPIWYLKRGILWIRQQ